MYHCPTTRVGFSCNVAVERVREKGLSCAIFAPGWTYEIPFRENKPEQVIRGRGGGGQGCVNVGVKNKSKPLLLYLLFLQILSPFLRIRLLR
jgi:hypothetical protein